MKRTLRVLLPVLILASCAPADVFGEIQAVQTSTAESVSIGTAVPAEDTSQSAVLYTHDLKLNMPPGWTLLEVNRRPLPTDYPEYSKNRTKCVDYEIHSPGEEAVLYLFPDCGYADTGPVECSPDIFVLMQNEDGTGVVRTFDSSTGMFSYSALGTAQTTGADGTVLETSICYSPPVLAFSGTGTVVMRISLALSEETANRESILQTADRMILSIRSAQ